MGTKTQPTRPAATIGGFLARARALEAIILSSGEVAITEDPLLVPYGLRPPKGAIQAWGMRARFEPSGSFTLVEARAGRNAQLGVSKERQGLFEEFVQAVAIPRLQELVRTLHRGDDREVSARIGRYVVRANPKASNGYLFLGAHELAVGQEGETVRET